MRMSPHSLVPACCFMLIAAVASHAADDTAPYGSKIDAWMEGSIVSLDAANGKIHGSRRKAGVCHSVRKDAERN